MPMRTTKLEANPQIELINSLFPGLDIMSSTDYLSIVRCGVSGEKLQAIVKLTGEKDLGYIQLKNNKACYKPARHTYNQGKR